MSVVCTGGTCVLTWRTDVGNVVVIELRPAATPVAIQRSDRCIARCTLCG